MSYPRTRNETLFCHCNTAYIDKSDLQKRQVCKAGGKTSLGCAEFGMILFSTRGGGLKAQKNLPFAATADEYLLYLTLALAS
jgi:hypothetical protein